MTYEEAKEKAVSWARSKGGPEFSEEKIIEGIENENAFVFIEKVPQKKTGKGKFDFFFISPRVFIVDRKRWIKSWQRMAVRVIEWQFLSL